MPEVQIPGLAIILIGAVHVADRRSWSLRRRVALLEESAFAMLLILREWPIVAARILLLRGLHIAVPLSLADVLPSLFRCRRRLVQCRPVHRLLLLWQERCLGPLTWNLVLGLAGGSHPLPVVVLVRVLVESIDLLVQRHRALVRRLVVRCARPLGEGAPLVVAGVVR